MRVDASFDAFVEARSSALLRTAYLLTGDHGHAEDLVQTALLRAARHWRRVRDAPEAYVRQILLNLSHDRIRLLRRRPREKPLSDDPDAGPRPARDPGDAMDQIGQRHQVADAVAHLPIRQRQVIVLRFFEDLSVAQTAKLLRCSEGTVKSYTARAVAQLRDLLHDEIPSNLEKEPDHVNR